MEVSSGRPAWLHLDMYRAIYEWRLSTRGTRKNFGIMLMLENDDREVGMARFASSTHANIDIRPQLLVCLSSSTW